MRLKAALARLERALPPTFLRPITTPDTEPAPAELVALYSQLSPDERDEVRAVLTAEPLPDDWQEQIDRIVGRALAGQAVV
jgi:hypothetical protein